MYWGRDCVDSTVVDIGCKREIFNGTEIDFCACNEEGCNKDMGQISTTTLIPSSTTTNKGNSSPLSSTRLRIADKM